ncbi:Notchless-like protein 1, partial [Armadillidium nasatum]
MEKILNTFLNETEPTPYNFFIDEQEVKSNLESAIDRLTLSEEKVLKILYQPQAVFKVRAVTRCSSSLQGHAREVLHASFSPDGQHLASGSGDTTVRFWDIKTETPHLVCKGHKLQVLVTSWSPDGERLATACAAGRVIIWNPSTGKQLGKTMMNHNKWVMALSWEPLHLTEDGLSIRLASGSKDGDVRIWNTILGTSVVLSNHTKCVTSLRWGGDGLIYSASEDRTIKVWRASDGVLCRTLEGHAHWVNTLALNTDYEDRKEKALKRYKEALRMAGEQERLVSGSDDFTLFLWEPSKSKKPLERMTGHQQLVNDVKFSPDTRLVASASFDKSIRLWNGLTGKFISTLRGHVSAVYQLCWSADSRLLLSGSKDSTLKVWNIANKKLEIELPGHADEVLHYGEDDELEIKL